MTTGQCLALQAGGTVRVTPWATERLTETSQAGRSHQPRPANAAAVTNGTFPGHLIPRGRLPNRAAASWESGALHHGPCESQGPRACSDPQTHPHILRGTPAFPTCHLPLALSGRPVGGRFGVLTPPRAGRQTCDPRKPGRFPTRTEPAGARFRAPAEWLMWFPVVGGTDSAGKTQGQETSMGLGNLYLLKQ